MLRYESYDSWIVGLHKDRMVMKFELLLTSMNLSRVKDGVGRLRVALSISCICTDGTCIVS